MMIGNFKKFNHITMNFKASTNYSCFDDFIENCKKD